MPQFLITAPDGGKYRITAPEGASEQDALAHFKQNYQPQEAQPQAASDASHGPLDVAGLPQPRSQAMPQPFAESDPNLSLHDLGQAGGKLAADVVGLPGDLERFAINHLGMGNEKNILPTSESLARHWLGQPQTPRDAGYRQLGDVASFAVPVGVPSAARGVAGAVAGTGRAVGSLASRAAKVIPTAQGKFADAAGAALKADSGKMIDAAIQDAQRTAAPQQAIEAAQAERPNATILEVKQPSPDAAKALSEARQNAQQSAQRLAKAKGDLDLANQNLAAASKYAEANRAARGPSTSATQVRGFQGVKARAQREFNEAQAAHDQAQTALKEAQATNRQAITSAKSASDEAKRASRKETVSLNQAKRDAKASIAITQRLKQLKAELDAPHSTPEQLASSAKSIGSVLYKNGHMTFDRYKEFLGQVNETEAKYKSQADAKKILKNILKGLLIGGGLSEAAGLSYELRRL